MHPSPPDANRPDTPPPSTIRLRRALSRHRIGLTELGLLLAAMLVLAYLCFSIDVFVNEDLVGPREQTLELDEVLLLSGALLLGLLAFAVRRYREQRRETRRRTEAEREARALAYQDPLTGLPNRRQFEEALRIAAASPPRAGSMHAVFMLDLNDFKQINDIHGHEAGDAVLVMVAQRLLRAVRTGEMVARLGGDEFVILAQHLLGPEAATSIALRVIHSLADPLVTGGVAHTVGAGIGISLLPNNTDSADEAMRRADVALYRAKAERRSAFRFFEEEMDALVRQRQRMEQALKQALSRGEIQPCFLPSHDLRTGRVTGFDMVPHWVTSDGEQYPPERFLPIAEETGLVHALAAQLLERACATARQWPADVTLAIDVLPGQLRDRQLAEGILKTVRGAGLAPGRLQVDIPENMVVQDMPAARSLIGPLQEAGVRIALDHFGTGYSNLYHIREFRFDKVKIDRRLVEHMDEVANARLVRALVGLGQGLGSVVSADGIASANESGTLLESGVQEGRTVGLMVSGDRTLDYFAAA